MADELDADYEVNWTGDTDFSITRTDRKSGAKTNLILARKALNFTLEFHASGFYLGNRTEISGGWDLDNEEFLERDDPQNDGIDWFYEGEPVQYKGGKPLVPHKKHDSEPIHTKAISTRHEDLIGTIKSSGRNQSFNPIRPHSFSKLGSDQDASTEGKIYIKQSVNPVPPRFLVIAYRDTQVQLEIQLQLDPKDFAGVAKGLSEGRKLWVNLSDFLFQPLLVTEDGLKALEHFYWVPYCEPFKEIYNRLRDKTGDAYHRLPEANFSFMGQYLPEEEEEEEKEFVDEVPTEDMTTTLIQQVSASLNQQQQMLMNLRRSTGFGNFLLFLILLATVYSIW